MPINPFKSSQLDFEQILPAVYDDQGRLRVDAEVTANISAPQEVIISDDDDSIKIGDGSGTYLKINPDGSINTTGGGSGPTDVNATIEGLATFQTSYYVVGTSPIQITTTPLADRSSVSIKVISTSSIDLVYVDNSNAVSDTSYPLFGGDTVQLDLKPTQPIWLVATAAGQKVYVMELGG